MSLSQIFIKTSNLTNNVESKAEQSAEDSTFIFSDVLKTFIGKLQAKGDMPSGLFTPEAGLKVSLDASNEIDFTAAYFSNEIDINIVDASNVIDKNTVDQNEQKLKSQPVIKNINLKEVEKLFSFLINRNELKAEDKLIPIREKIIEALESGAAVEINVNTGSEEVKINISSKNLIDNNTETIQAESYEIEKEEISIGEKEVKIENTLHVRDKADPEIISFKSDNSEEKKINNPGKNFKNNESVNIIDDKQQPEIILPKTEKKYEKKIIAGKVEIKNDDPVSHLFNEKASPEIIPIEIRKEKNENLSAGKAEAERNILADGFIKNESFTETDLFNSENFNQEKIIKPAVEFIAAEKEPVTINANDVKETGSEYVVHSAYVQTETDHPKSFYEKIVSFLADKHPCNNAAVDKSLSADKINLESKAASEIDGAGNFISLQESKNPAANPLSGKSEKISNGKNSSVINNRFEKFETEKDETKAGHISTVSTPKAISQSAAGEESYITEIPPEFKASHSPSKENNIKEPIKLKNEAYTKEIDAKDYQEKIVTAEVKKNKFALNEASNGKTENVNDIKFTFKILPGNNLLSKQQVKSDYKTAKLIEPVPSEGKKNEAAFSEINKPASAEIKLNTSSVQKSVDKEITVDEVKFKAAVSGEKGTINLDIKNDRPDIESALFSERRGDKLNQNSNRTENNNEVKPEFIEAEKENTLMNDKLKPGEDKEKTIQINANNNQQVTDIGKNGRQEKSDSPGTPRYETYTLNQNKTTGKPENNSIDLKNPQVLSAKKINGEVLSIKSIPQSEVKQFEIKVELIKQRPEAYIQKGNHILSKNIKNIHGENYNQKPGEKYNLPEPKYDSKKEDDKPLRMKSLFNSNPLSVDKNFLQGKEQNAAERFNISAWERLKGIKIENDFTERVENEYPKELLKTFFHKPAVESAVVQPVKENLKNEISKSVDQNRINISGNENKYPPLKNPGIQNSKEENLTADKELSEEKFVLPKSSTLNDEPVEPKKNYKPESSRSEIIRSIINSEDNFNVPYGKVSGLPGEALQFSKSERNNRPDQLNKLTEAAIPESSSKAEIKKNDLENISKADSLKESPPVESSGNSETLDKNLNKNNEPLFKINENETVKVRPVSGSEPFNIADNLRSIQQSPHIKDEIKNIKQHEIADEINRLFTSGGKQKVTLNIQPEELGKVKIEFELKDKNLTAKIEVESVEIKNLIQSGSEKLRESLIQNGITLNSLNIHLSDNTRRQKTELIKKRSLRFNTAEMPKEISAIKNRSLGYNTYEFIA